MTTALTVLAAIGLVAAAVLATRDVFLSGDGAAAVVVGSFLTYVAVAEFTVGRARARRQATTRAAVGLARWAPTFAWVPYLVVALHVGPELSFVAPVRWVGVTLTVGGV